MGVVSSTICSNLISKTSSRSKRPKLRSKFATWTKWLIFQITTVPCAQQWITMDIWSMGGQWPMHGHLARSNGLSHVLTSAQSCGIPAVWVFALASLIPSPKLQQWVVKMSSIFSLIHRRVYGLIPHYYSSSCWLNRDNSMVTLYGLIDDVWTGCGRKVRFWFCGSRFIDFLCVF